MALINCTKCGNQISDKAPSCPHCGEVFAPQLSQQNVGGSYIQPNQPANQNVQMQAAAKPVSKNKIVVVIIVILVLIASAVVSIIVPLINKNQKDAEEYASTYQPQGIAASTDTYTVTLNVICVQNKVNKYDVDVIVDGETIDTLPHGKSKTYTVKLKGGSHIVEFSVNGKTFFLGNDIDTDNATSTLYVDNDISVSYTVKCTTGNNIEIQEHS